MTINFDDKIPPHTQPGLELYLEERIEPGGFLRAVLENNLREAMGRADQINRYALFDIVSWLFTNAPSASWGSPEKVATWLAGRKKDE